MISLGYCMEATEPFYTRGWSHWKRRLVFNRAVCGVVDVMLEYAEGDPRRRR